MAPATKPSWASSNAARKTMVGNKARDTAPEMAVRRALHARGLRYRVNAAPIPGFRRTADILFTKQRIAVFIDGCFWHGCPLHYVAPVANATFWSAKVASNMARDLNTNERLATEGWTAIRFWEHEPADAVATQIEKLVRRAGTSGRE